jgi:hypothetical protein
VIPAIQGVDSVEQLYDRLADYAKRQENGKRIPPTADAINQILLKSAALIEYNGQRWYRVHPLVVDNLRELGKL